jgi:opacity protein-like surface antigen
MILYVHYGLNYRDILMKAWKLLSAFCLIFTITPLFAKEVKVIQVEEISYVKIEVDDDEGETYWDQIGILGSIRGGIDYAKVGGESSDVVLFEGSLPNKYVPEDTWHTAAMGSALVGFEFPLDGDYRWQTAVSYYISGNYHVKGDDLIAGEEVFDFFDYKYKVLNQRVLWENRWLAELNEVFLVYFMGGIGASFNKAYDFEETNNGIAPNFFTNPPFEEKTTTSFTYSLGFGFEAEITDELRVGIGYQYSDLGKVELGKIDAPDMDDHLSIDNSPTQEVFLSLTYFFKD